MKKMSSMIVSLLRSALVLLFAVQIGQTQSLTATGAFDLDGATCRFATGGEAERVFPYWQVCVDNDGKVYRLRVENNAISELYVEGEKIPLSQIPDFKSFIAPYIQSITQKLDVDRRQAELEGQLERLDAYQRATVGNRLLEITAELQSLDRDLSKSDRLASLDTGVQYDNRESLSRKRCKLAHEQDMLSVENDELNEKREILLRYRNELSRKATQISEAEIVQRGKVMQAIIADLKKENLVLNTRAMSFKLSNVELVVNGKKADDATHQKLCAKYAPAVASGETGFMYHWKIRQAK